MAKTVELDEGEQYVLCNWLRIRENRLMSSLRPRSADWRTVHDLRTKIEEQQTPDSSLQRITLSEREWTTVCEFLRRRSRWLRFKPWRDRERRNVRHLRSHVLAQLDADG